MLLFIKKIYRKKGNGFIKRAAGINLIYLLGLTTLPFAVIAQPNTLECKNLREGLFYYYSKVDNNNSLFVREKNIQKEINRDLGDTTVWKISWKDDCRYVLTYLAGNLVLDEMKKKSADLLTINVKITAVNADYYLYEASNKKNPNTVINSDTLWLSDQPMKMAKKNVIDASFAGGSEAWKEYLLKVFSKNEEALGSMRKGGTCFVRFIVDVDGSVSEVTPLTMAGTIGAKLAVDAITNGPKWIPATLEGKPMKSVKIQPVTFQFTK